MPTKRLHSGNATVAIIAVTMTAALWVSGLERYRSLVVALFFFAGLCVAGLALARGLKHWQRTTWLVGSALWICYVLASAYAFRPDWQHGRSIVEGLAIGFVVLVPTVTIIPAAIWLLGRATASVTRRSEDHHF